MKMEIRGVYAALLTPRRPDDAVDTNALEHLIAFLREHEIELFVANGATGEFCLTTPPQLRVLLQTIRNAGGSKAGFLCGIGAAGLEKVLELASIAADEGAKALLVPAPYFFRYEQEDLEAFYQTVASRVSLPVILYNLPQFTSGLLPDTACRLVREVPNIIGIKDSSGSLDILQSLTDAGAPCSRVVGNDGVLARALRVGVCDGVVSGVACVLPELIKTVFENHAAGDTISVRAEELLAEFIREIDAFPVPWGLRWALEARGVAKAWSAQPISPGRAARATSMISWFQEWYRAVPDLIATGTQG